ncbi:MAG TPA: haloacid dehalogenase [Cyanobacteria bacterium UBA11049]|nr:haloacid dehalogenase [Cyanobacteria bacterium UBA11049]
MRFIDRFEAILLDMGNTFMFDCDRFSNLDNFAKTYSQLGGTQFNNVQVKAIVSGAIAQMGYDYENPEYYECFPSIISYLYRILRQNDLPTTEIELLEKVITIHEIGTIPDTHAEAVRQLRITHKLGVVSNIWCQSKFCLEEFHRVGINDIFTTNIFSSDYGIIKPSPLIFQKAIEEIGVHESKIVFIGDSLKYDIAGAKAVNLATVWINSEQNELEQNTISDLIIQDLKNLVQ